MAASLPAPDGSAPTPAATTAPPRPDARGLARRSRRAGLPSPLRAAGGGLQGPGGLRRTAKCRRMVLRGRGIPAGGLRRGSSGEAPRAGRRETPREPSAAAEAHHAALPPHASTTKPAANGLQRGCPHAASILGHLPPLPGRFPRLPPRGAAGNTGSGRAAEASYRSAETYTLPAAGLRNCLHSPRARARSEAAALCRRPRRSPGHRQLAGGRRAVPAAGSAREATGSESGGTGPSERAAPEPLTYRHLPAALPHSSPPGPARRARQPPAAQDPPAAAGPKARHRCPGSWRAGCGAEVKGTAARAAQALASGRRWLDTDRGRVAEEKRADQQL